MNWNAIRCVGFDFDGTLVDSNAIKRDSYFEALAPVAGAREVIEAVLREHPRDDRHGTLARVHARLSVPARGSGEGSRDPLPPVADWVDAYAAVCEARVIACPPIPGALPALDALAGSHALYLASATPEDALVRVVAGRGWTDRFRGVFGGPRSKVENLVRIALGEGLEREQIVYVGDGAVDRDAAREFGCPFFGFGSDPDALPEGPLAPLISELAARSGRVSAA